MSAPNFTPIQLYRTATAAATPSAGNLADGELAINLTDEKLYFKNASGVVKLLASNSGSLGSVTSVAVSGGTTGLTTSGGPITGSGTITLGGTLAVANGGTGVTTSTGTGSVVRATSPTLVTPNLGTPSAATLTNATGLPLTTGVTGTLAVANGGTGVTTSTGTGSVVLSSSPTLVTPVLGAASATSIAAALGAAGTPSYTFTGDLDTGMWSPAANTVAVSTAATERMRITSTGNVGIGTSAPDGTLTLASVIPLLYWNETDQDVDEKKWRFGVQGKVLSLQTANDAISAATNAYQIVRGTGTDVDRQIFYTGASVERMRITSAGNVGIGTSSPGGKLHTQLATSFTWGGGWNSGVAVFGGAGSNSGALAVSYNDTDGAIIGSIAPGTAWKPVKFYSDSLIFATNGSTERMRITSTGNVGINESAPDYKLDVNGTFGFTPGSSVTPVDNGDVVFELTNNTTLTIKAKGSDGVVRSATITLA